MLALTACTPSSQSTPSSNGSTLVIADGADTTEMNPQTSLYDSSWRIEDMVYDSLVTTDDKSDILPSLAESWIQDGNSYVFTLRDGVKFSNGRALTADDVVGSLQMLLDPATGSYWASQLGPVTAITAVNDKTVRIDLSAPYTPFLAALASTSAAILPMKEYQDGTFDPSTEMLGTGPFVVDSHTQDQEWQFSANPGYWGAADMDVKAVTLKIVPDDSARIAGLRNGSVDIAYFANPDAPTLLNGVQNVETTVQGSSDTYWLILNAANPDSPFADKAQRQALATAINRDGLIDTALAGAGEATGISPATLPGSCSPDSLPTYDADPAAATNILDGSAAASFNLMAPPYLTSFKPIAQYLQQDAQAAGFNATIETPEMGDYVDRVYTQNPADFDAVIDYFAGYLSPAMAPANAVVIPGETSEFSGFAVETPGLADALAAATSATDTASETAALQTACELVAENAFIIPLATKSTTIGVRTDRVDGTIPAFDGYDIYLRNITTYALKG
ncbi:ABC transporter substrate-binding protein (plasmid) [Herbiconiux sp. KACC 21604]|uniref:ABC transporter substrate-binding protein n=1 Tax=unclassified Herbiconiux TaxID=2618217 RepID=UPI00149281A6|nr:ABC transporter substrate-binding protein [Herbiconiux sp. SALV-R1]QJU56347.1 ABC transporter substrate-binding protein [Herbiconiux sp. SALV-R1]WPO88854.1 ABC transporter substrate-binding protein [Herbiconiux sp. KACC 21604]